MGVVECARGWIVKWNESNLYSFYLLFPGTHELPLLITNAFFFHVQYSFVVPLNHVETRRRDIIMLSPSSHHHGEHLTTALRRIGIHVNAKDHGKHMCIIIFVWVLKTETGVCPGWRFLAATPFRRPSNFVDIGGEVPSQQEDIAPSEVYTTSKKIVDSNLFLLGLSVACARLKWT